MKLGLGALALVALLLASWFALRSYEGEPEAGPGGGAGVDPAAVDELRRQVARLEARVQELEAGRLESDLRSADEVLTAALREPSPELDELVAAAVARVRDAKDESPGAKGETVDPKKVAGILASVDAELDRWSEDYGLSSAQVEEVRALAKSSIHQLVQAKARGASDRELIEMQVAARAEVRRILGDRVYFATERERINRETRSKLFWVSAAVGGLSDEQHRELDRAIEEGVETNLADVVRLRSEPMPERDYDATLERLQQGRDETWRHIRDEILTEEQRRRIPGK